MVILVLTRLSIFLLKEYKKRDDKRNNNKDIKNMGKKKTDKVDTVKQRIAKNKKKFLKALKESFGIIGVASKKANISRETFYQWRRADPSFKKKAEEIDDDFSMIVDDKIKKGIIADDGNMIRFYASRRMKQYRAKNEISLDDDFSFHFTIKTIKNKKDE